MIRHFILLGVTTLVHAAEPLEWKQLPPLPEPLGVAAPFAGVCGSSLVVAGGANFPGGMPWQGGAKVWHDRIWALDKANGGWREAGKLPRPLAYGVSVTARGGVVCIGGSDAARHYADVSFLSVQGATVDIKPLAPLPIPLANMAGALVDDTVFVAGGAQEPGELAATNRAFAFDLEKNAWREIEPLPGKGRILAAGACDGGAFLLMGGVSLVPATDGKSTREYLRDAWSYSPGKGWTRLPDLPKPVAAAPSPAPSLHGGIWLIGGDDGSRFGFQPVEKHPGFPGTIFAYMNGKWSEHGVAPAPRATVPTVGWNGMIVIPSGEVRPGVRSQEVWAASPGVWTSSGNGAGDGRRIRIRSIGNP